MLFGSPLILVAVGMTLVIATGGIDLSVGAVVAITGALTCSYISDQADQNALSGVFLAMGIGLVAAVVCGLWNGFLVARMGIQPIIATLIIMVAGRGVAQLITDGQIITDQQRAVQADRRRLLADAAVLHLRGGRGRGRHRGADPPYGARPARRVGRRQRRGQPPGRHQVPAHQDHGVRVLRACARASRA